MHQQNWPARQWHSSTRQAAPTPSIPSRTLTCHATYLRIAAALKPHKAEECRVYFTVAGGNRIDYTGKTYTPTADLTTIKIHANSILSTKHTKFMTINIKSFYLSTLMPCNEYMQIPVKDIPLVIMDHYHLAPLVHNGYILVKIRKGMYGLPHAGILANNHLVMHLAKYGYSPVKRTPGLYLHHTVKRTQPITFTLVVGNFGVKYVGKENAQHLVDCLNNLYTITSDWTGSVYCGITFEWDYINHTANLSMPGCIANALKKFNSPPPK
jgi:hypothetical protein